MKTTQKTKGTKKKRIGVQDVAKHFGVTTRTVRKWRERADPMPGKDGEFDIEKIAKWRELTFQKDKRQRPIDVEGNDKGQASSEIQRLRLKSMETKLRKDHSLARQAEIKAQRMDDEFVALGTVREWVSEFLIQQRNLLTSIPVEMFAAAPDEHREIYEPDLKARIDIHLNQMGDYIERVEDLRDSE